jgi:hypothetical protein
MDVRTRHTAKDYGRLMAGIGLLLLGIFFAVLVCWMVLSKQDSKLYEADNVVCVSQPFSVQCFERKPR